MKQVCDFGHDTHMQLRILPYANGNLHVCHEHYQQEMVYRKNQGHTPFEASFFGPVFPAWTELGIYYPPYSDEGKLLSMTHVHLVKEKTYPYKALTGISDHSQIWAALYAVAVPIVEHYHSDLYYDALIVSQFDHTTTEFWYGVGNCGTTLYYAIAGDPEFSGKQLALKHLDSRPYLYHCAFIPGAYGDTLKFLVIEIHRPEEKK